MPYMANGEAPGVPTDVTSGKKCTRNSGFRPSATGTQTTCNGDSDQQSQKNILHGGGDYRIPAKQNVTMKPRFCSIKGATLFLHLGIFLFLTKSPFVPQKITF